MEKFENRIRRNGKQREERATRREGFIYTLSSYSPPCEQEDDSGNREIITSRVGVLIPVYSVTDEPIHISGVIVSR